PIPSYSLNYYISTNGSLLNEQKIDMMIKKGLNRYQITLDGLPETHNKRRSCGKDTFNIIWKNILYIIRNSGFVELLFVADMENINDFVPLIEFLNKESKREPLIKEKIRVHTSLVEPVEACMERAKQFLLGKEKEIAIKIIEGLKYAKHLGFKIYLPYYSNVCLRQLYYGFLIDPDGDVYKCYGAGGDKRYKIGSIDTPIDKILESARKWADMDVWDKECLNCQIFPLCRGAFCQHQAAQFFDGEYGHKFCNKELDIFFIKESIKHLY
ncbi:MAG: SPASM domain-containing protein, partial [Candidatus Micrarchaeia archaeon]